MPLETYGDLSSIARRQEALEKEVNNFKALAQEKFSGPELKQVLSALDFMLKIHLPQSDRVDGKPFASHPLAVAEKVINLDPDPELVCAALLHDGVEDQCDQIFASRVNRKFPQKNFLQFKVSPEAKAKHREIFKDWSFKEIKERFGEQVEYYVENMTNHDYYGLADDLGLYGEEKADLVNRLYSEHVEMVLDDPKLFTLKLADLSVNIDLHSLPEGSEKQLKLKRKYKSVIEMVISKLENINEQHPLFKQRDQVTEELKNIYKEQYQD